MRRVGITLRCSIAVERAVSQHARASVFSNSFARHRRDSDECYDVGALLDLFAVVDPCPFPKPVLDSGSSVVQFIRLGFFVEVKIQDFLLHNRSEKPPFHWVQKLGLSRF